MSVQWTEQDVLAVVEDMRRYGNDTSLVEVKRAAGGLPGLAETICAFANMPQGGTVILGIDEAHNFAVVGVAEPGTLVQGLIDQARALVQPTPQIEAYPLEVGGATLVVAEIRALAPTQKPARTHGVPYLRQGDGDYEMNPNDIHMLNVAALNQTERQVYDAAPAPGASASDLDENLVQDYVRVACSSSRRLANMEEKQVLRVTSVLDGEGVPTVAGLYALGEYPQGALPALGVTAAVRMPRESGERSRNLHHFDGPVAVMLEEIMQWVENNISTVQVYRDDGHLIHRPEFPLSAIREIVANALIHRDMGPDTLGVGKRVEIRLTPYGFIVESPGGLRGISQGQLHGPELAKAAVNQRLYEMAKRLRTSEGIPVIEGEGGGMREVFAAMKEWGLAEPKLFDNGTVFRVVLLRAREAAPRTQYDDDRLRAISLNAPSIVRSLGSSGQLSVAEIAHETGLSSAQVRYAITALMRENVVRMVGSQGDRRTWYRLVE